MKRAGRIVYRLLSGLSLLLLLATAGVWVRSYWVSDRLVWSDSPADRLSVWSSRGGVQFASTRYFPAQARSPFNLRYWHGREPATTYPVFGDYWDPDWDPFLDPKPRHYAGLGFEWIRETAAHFSVGINSLTLPLYFPSLLLAILPMHSFLRLRRRRRIARRIALGCCIGCGYDLRASSGRCPECGREVENR